MTIDTLRVDYKTWMKKTVVSERVIDQSEWYVYHPEGGGKPTIIPEGTETIVIRYPLPYDMVGDWIIYIDKKTAKVYGYSPRS